MQFFKHGIAVANTPRLAFVLSLILRDKILTMDEYIQDSYQKDPESSGNKHFPPELYRYVICERILLY